MHIASMINFVSFECNSTSVASYDVILSIFRMLVITPKECNDELSVYKTRQA